MCETCGCGVPPQHDGEEHTHEGEGHHHHHHDATRTLEIRTDVLARNDAFAVENRHRLDDLGTVAFNLISSPGAGKTTLLEALIRALDEVPVAVIEGDLQTDRDAARIRGTGAPVHQINTGEGCHLDAHMVGHAMEHLELPRRGVVFIENVGNLVCPASFDLGERFRVVVLSVAEGDDKVEKYPISFRSADAMVINKIDLLEHVDFSIDRCRTLMAALNPEAVIFEVSARRGDGIDALCQWVRSKLT